MEAIWLSLRVKHVASCTSACCCLMACNPTISAAGLARQSALSPASSLYLHHATSYLYSLCSKDTIFVRQAGAQRLSPVYHLAI